MEFKEFSPDPRSHELGFVVVRNKIYVTPPNNFGTPMEEAHLELVDMHHLSDQLEELREKNPDEIDAGLARVINDRAGRKGIVAIFGRSQELGLPITAMARDLTILKFPKQSHEIRKV